MPPLSVASGQSSLKSLLSRADALVNHFSFHQYKAFSHTYTDWDHI